MCYKNKIKQIISQELPDYIDQEIIKFDSHDNYTCKVADLCIKIARTLKYNLIVIKQFELLKLINIKISTPKFIKIGNIYGLNYSVNKWIDGNILYVNDLFNNNHIYNFLDGLCDFYNELYNINIDNFYRGDHISVYEDHFYDLLNKYNIVNTVKIKGIFENGVKNIFMVIYFQIIL